jgi:hypothetical protein
MKLPTVRWIVVLAIFTMILAISGIGSSLASNPNAGCNQTPYDNPGNGANHSGAYDDTCDGSASGNGNGSVNGVANAVGKPCAGCVGQADEKNPPGQANDGTDANNGYECDGNSGIAKTNPAHTGCASAVTPTPTPTPSPSTGPLTEVLGEKFLATTGAPTSMFFGIGVLFIATGLGLRLRARKPA